MDWRVKAVIFDMDGVLVDSFEAHFLAWNHTFRKEFGFTITREEFKNQFGKYPPKILEDVLKQHGIESTQEAYDREPIEEDYYLIDFVVFVNNWKASNYGLDCTHLKN